MKLLLQAWIRACDWQSHHQPFDILHEYASEPHVSECPSRFASARVLDEPS